MTYNRVARAKTGAHAHPFMPEIEPDLAESWESSPDSSEFTFHLHQGIKTHNVEPTMGREFTAEDIKLSMERYKGGGSQQDVFAPIESIETPDNYTVVVKLNQPLADFPTTIASWGFMWPKELIEDAGPLDILLVPCGGGGLLSGCSIAAQHLSPACRVIGVEPAAGDDGLRSFRSGKLERVPLPATIADGARTMSLGELTFSIIRENVSDFHTVTDDELLQWMFFLWERMKIVVEPTGALAAAALLAGKLDARGRKVGVVISGGNVDLGWAARQLAAR